jgi:APA family basic amino acid/polyamine antiporter
LTHDGPVTSSLGTPTATGAEAAAESRLPRRLGLGSALAVVMGSMIGSGIFRVPGAVAADTGTIGAMMLAWVVAGLVTLCGALALAEVAALFPRVGGLYVYLHAAYGRLTAFLFGWLILIISPALNAAVALVFGEYIGRLLSLTPLQVHLTAAAAIVVVATSNYRSVSYGAAIQKLTAAAKVTAILALTVAAFVAGQGASANWHSDAGLAPHTWGGFGLALVAVLWAYNGWQDVTYVGGEVREPQRTLPRAILGGTFGVMLIYLAINAAYVHVLSVGGMAQSPLVAADVAVRLVGRAGDAAIAALVCVSTFGTLNGGLLVFPRVFFAMADDGLFFRKVAAVHPRFGTPHVAIVLSAVLAVAYLSLRSFEQLIEIAVLGQLPFWALSVGAVLVLRRTLPELPRPYRSPGYPIVPLLFIAAMLALLANSLREHPESTAWTLGAVLAGIPVYFGWRQFGARR